MNRTKIQKARAKAGQTAEQMSRYAAALHRFAAGIESSEDRQLLFCNILDGLPCFPVAGLSYALKSAEATDANRDATTADAVPEHLKPSAAWTARGKAILESMTPEEIALHDEFID